jgi:hypothetical protein
MLIMKAVSTSWHGSNCSKARPKGSPTSRSFLTWAWSCVQPQLNKEVRERFKLDQLIKSGSLIARSESEESVFQLVSQE